MTSTFAKKHLESLGWESGQGLGVNKQGMSDAIKPDLKRDQAGLGHIGEEFGFAWWDHCFTKAAKKIKVEHCEKSGEVKVRAEKTTIETKLASRRAPTSLLYGSFVAAKKEGEDAEDDGVEDHSTLSKLTDEEVFRRCGGRTAHKGARHNISQVAKLKRSKEDKLLKTLADDAEAGDLAEGAMATGPGDDKKKKDKAKKKDKGADESASNSKKSKKSKSAESSGEGKVSEKKAKKGDKEKKDSKKKSKSSEKEGTASKKTKSSEREAKASKKEKTEKASKADGEALDKGSKKSKKGEEGPEKDSKKSKKRK